MIIQLTLLLFLHLFSIFEILSYLPPLYFVVSFDDAKGGEESKKVGYHREMGMKESLRGLKGEKKRS